MNNLCQLTEKLQKEIIASNRNFLKLIHKINYRMCDLFEDRIWSYWWYEILSQAHAVFFRSCKNFAARRSTYGKNVERIRMLFVNVTSISMRVSSMDGIAIRDRNDVIIFFSSHIKKRIRRGADSQKHHSSLYLKPSVVRSRAPHHVSSL